MSKIKDREEKSTEEILESGYYAIFGDIDIARTISKTHATAIVNGTELEKLIYESIKCDKYENLSYEETLELINKNKGTPIYFKNVKIHKRIYEQHGYKLSGKNNTNLDNLFYDGDKKIYINEFKDGASLDTKKSEIEVDSVVNISNLFNNEGLNIESYGTLTLWRCSNLEHSSIKTKRDDFLKITGKDYCEIIDIDFKKIQDERDIDQDDNIKSLANGLSNSEKFTKIFLEIYKNKKED